MRRRAILSYGRGEKMELYLTTTNSQIESFAITFINPKDSKPVFIVKNVDGVELFRQNSTRFNFVGFVGVKRIFYQGTERQIKGIENITVYSNQSNNIYDRDLSPLLINLQTFVHSGIAAYISAGISGIPNTLVKLKDFRCFGSANSYFNHIDDVFDFETLRVEGQNTLSELPALPVNTSLTITGQNTLSELPALPVNTSLTITGQNTLSELPALPVNTSLRIEGQNTQPIVDLYTEALKVTFCTIGTANGLSKISYTGRRDFPDTMRRVVLRDGSGGLSTDSDQVANLIIDLSKSNWDNSSINNFIEIRGNALSPTPSPELTAALAYFQNIGIPVHTN